MSAILNNFNSKCKPISMVIELGERKNSNAAFGQYCFALSNKPTNKLQNL